MFWISSNYVKYVKCKIRFELNLMNNVSTKMQIGYKLQNRSLEEHFILIIGWKWRNINDILVANFCNLLLTWILGIHWWVECTNDGLSPMSKRICYFFNDVRFIATFIDKYIWIKSTSMSDSHEHKKKTRFDEI